MQASCARVPPAAPHACEPVPSSCAAAALTCAAAAAAPQQRCHAPEQPPLPLPLPPVRRQRAWRHHQPPRCRPAHAPRQASAGPARSRLSPSPSAAACPAHARAAPQAAAGTASCRRHRHGRMHATPELLLCRHPAMRWLASSACAHARISMAVACMRMAPPHLASSSLAASAATRACSAASCSASTFLSRSAASACCVSSCASIDTPDATGVRQERVLRGAGRGLRHAWCKDTGSSGVCACLCAHHAGLLLRTPAAARRWLLWPARSEPPWT